MEKFNYNLNNILNYILAAIDEKQITKKDLASACGTTPPTLSKILSGTSAISLEMYISICKALSIDPALLLSAQSTEEIINASHLIDNVKSESSVDTDTDSLLYDPTRRPFRGILTDADIPSDCYHVYLKPTISNEKSKILHGQLRIFPSIENPGTCRAEFCLETGRVGRDKQKITKLYEGQMIVSLPMGSCYVILYSEKHAEISIMIFKHMFLNDDQLQCRIAAVATVSAGSNRRPVMEKAILSRTNLDRNIEKLEGQLFMNTSIISFQEELFDKLAECEGIFECSPDQIPSQIEQLRKLAGIPVSRYELDEGKIRSSADFSSSEKIHLINFLRKNSNSPCYCKISSHADELLYESIVEEYEIL